MMNRDQVERLYKGDRRVLVRTRKGLTEGHFLGICFPPGDAEPKNAKVSIDGTERYVPFEKLELPT